MQNQFHLSELDVYKRQIYMQQQKAELAALELEKALFKEITRVQMLLTKLIDAELASGNTESACKIAEKSSSMVDVFDMWEYNRYIASYQILEQKQNADATLHLLEQMLEALTTHWSLTCLLYTSSFSWIRNRAASLIPWPRP